MKHILIVEDQEDLRTILRELLTGSGYKVSEAGDGAEAVAQVKALRPDLILMDIQLPGVDGYEATRRIKLQPALAATPIIAVSSFAMRGDEEKALAGRLRPLRDQTVQPNELARHHSRHPQR